MTECNYTDFVKWHMDRIAFSPRKQWLELSMTFIAALIIGAQLWTQDFSLVTTLLVSIPAISSWGMWYGYVSGVNGYLSSLKNTLKFFGESEPVSTCNRETSGDVELHMAFMWTCDGCGRDNFERSVSVEPDSVDSLPVSLDGVPEGERVKIQSFPGQVYCTHCDCEFSTVFDV